MGDNMLTKQSMVKKSSNGKDTLHASKGSSSLVVKSRIQKSIKASKNHHFGQVAVVKTLLQKNDILVLISMLTMCPNARRTKIFLSDWFGSDCLFVCISVTKTRINLTNVKQLHFQTNTNNRLWCNNRRRNPHKSYYYIVLWETILDEYSS